MAMRKLLDMTTLARPAQAGRVAPPPRVPDAAGPFRTRTTPTQEGTLAMTASTLTRSTIAHPTGPTPADMAALSDATTVQAARDALSDLPTEPAVYVSALEHRHLAVLLAVALPGVRFDRAYRRSGLIGELLFVDTLAPATEHHQACADDCAEHPEGCVQACAEDCVLHGPVTAVRAVLTYDFTINHTVVRVASVGNPALWDRIVAHSVMWEAAGRPVPDLDAVRTVADAVEQSGGVRR